MRLLVTTPMAVAVDEADVRSLRARDDSGSFGVQPGHADLLTVLPISVLAWRDAGGDEHYVALRGGVLEVRDGQTVAVASREAVCGDDLARLEDEVLSVYRRRQDEERAAHSQVQRLSLAAVKHIFEHLRPDQGGLP